MKWTGIYLVGYILLIAGLSVALWKWGVFEQLGTTWTLVCGLVVAGIGVMLAVANSGRKETIEIDTD